MYTSHISETQSHSLDILQDILSFLLLMPFHDFSDYAHS